MYDSEFRGVRRYRLMVDRDAMDDGSFLAEDALGAMRLAERLGEGRCMTIVEDGRPLIRMRRGCEDAGFWVLNPLRLGADCAR